MRNKILKSIRKNIHITFFLFLIVLFVYVGLQPVNAARTIDFFKKSADNIIFTNALYELGSNSDRVAKGWFTDLDTTTITISGASAGALDMGGFAITNAGTITATNFIATSTLDVSTFLGNVGIGTTSPSQRLHVFSNGAPTTTSEFGDISSTTAKTCFNVNATDGSAASFYFNPDGIVFETNACK